MLELNSIQEQILSKIATNKEKIPLSDNIGMTSGGLGRSGINRRTFENNSKTLVEEQLIKLVRQDAHGKQKWRYYEITPLGVLALLGRKSNKELSKKNFLEVFARFFPLIMNHWDELSDLYGNAFFSILRQSINQIELRYSAELIGVEPNNPLARQIMEVVRLPSNSYDIEVSLLRFYNKFTVEEKNVIANSISLEQKKTFGNILEPMFQNYDEIYYDIVKRLTFVFYFNLIRLSNDLLFAQLIFLRNYRPTNTEKSLAKQIIKNSKMLLKFAKEMDKASTQVLSLIKNDSMLKELIRDTVEEFQEKLKPPKTIEQLSSIV